MAEPLRAWATSARNTTGGHTATSARGAVVARSASSRPLISSALDARLPCIFQLPTTSFFMALTVAVAAVVDLAAAGPRPHRPRRTQPPARRGADAHGA